MYNKCKEHDFVVLSYNAMSFVQSLRSSNEVLCVPALCPNLVCLDSSLDTLWRIRIQWSFGKPNLVISPTQHKLYLTSSLAAVSQSGYGKVDWLCCFHMDTMAKVLSIQVLDWSATFRSYLHQPFFQCSNFLLWLSRHNFITSRALILCRFILTVTARRSELNLICSNKRLTTFCS